VAANVQSGQGRFTVVILPILQIVLETLILPYKHLPELVKYGWIPFVGMLAARLLEWFLSRMSVPSYVVTGIMPIAHLALFVPFSVVWTRIALQEANAKLPDEPFRYDATEWKYLGASFAMTVVVALLVGLPLMLYRYGQETFQTQLTVTGTLLMVTGGVLAGVVFVRFCFVFPALAIGRFNGLGPAWRQTAGNIESLAAVMALAFAPYLIINQVIRFVVGYPEPGLTAVIAAVLEILAASMVINANTLAPALMYKKIVLGHMPVKAAGAATPLAK